MRTALLEIQIALNATLGNRPSRTLFKQYARKLGAATGRYEVGNERRYPRISFPGNDDDRSALSDLPESVTEAMKVSVPIVKSAKRASRFCEWRAEPSCRNQRVAFTLHAPQNGQQYCEVPTDIPAFLFSA